MNSIFSGHSRILPVAGTMIAMAALVAGIVVVSPILHGAAIRAQTASDPVAEFKRISEELSADRLSGGAENEALMEKALVYLDSVAVSVLNNPGGPNLDVANRSLAGLVSHTPPVGENYRLLRLGGTPAAYAMAVNFGLGGPAAVRIYSGSTGNYVLAARIDHIVQKDFFDSDLELVSISNSEPVFITISGRTDDLSTGLFSAWQFEGLRVLNLWNSDLLQQSSYAADENGFHLAYCSQVNEDHPSQCLKMSRDLYRFQSGEWKRIETADMPPAGPTAK